VYRSGDGRSFLLRPKISFWISLDLRHSLSNLNYVSKNFDGFSDGRIHLKNRSLSQMDPFYLKPLSGAKDMTSTRRLTGEARIPVMSDNMNLMIMFNR
jgi:hypothetical protein